MIDWYYYGKTAPSPLPTLCWDVLAFGASKYASLNYAKGMLYSRVFNSFMRHCSYVMLVGEQSVDDESNLPHSHHAECNILFAYTYQILNYDYSEFDNRPLVSILKREEKK